MPRQLTLRDKILIVLTTPLYLLWYTWVFACATIVPMGGFLCSAWVFAAWVLTLVGIAAYVRLKGAE
jgi:hypothetical protein